MSLYAYCRKASNGEQKSHCNKKCDGCMMKINRIRKELNQKFRKIK